MDASLFVGRRDELAAFVGALGQDLNVALIGEPGTGKTSLLHALQHQLRRSLEPGPAATGEWELAYVRAEGARNAAEILTRVAVEVLGRRTAVTVDGGAPGA